MVTEFLGGVEVLIKYGVLEYLGQMRGFSTTDCGGKREMIKAGPVPVIYEWHRKISASLL
jgi:hypothetical protein